MRAGIDGDGVVRNTVTFAPQATGSVGATVAVYDIYDRLARTSGSSGSTAVICAKCHDLEDEVPVDPANPTGRKTVVGSNTAHNSHHQDTTDGSAQCVACHIGVPHGWKRPRLLVNTDVDVAPYLDPESGGVYRSNGMDFAYRWDGTGVGLHSDLQGRRLDRQRSQPGLHEDRHAVPQRRGQPYPHA